MQSLERSIKKFLPRRSPRLIAKNKENYHAASSTSIQDLNLPALQDQCKVSKTKKRQPLIKRAASQNKLNLGNQERSLKRMRDITLSQRSLPNLVPTKKPKHEDFRATQEEFWKADPMRVKIASRVVGSLTRNLVKKKKAAEVQRASSLRLSKNSSTNNTFSSSKNSTVRPAPVRRDSKLWIESVSSNDTDFSEWTPQQIKRQEAIYELYCGEKDLVEDFQLLQKVYINPISTFNLLQQSDIDFIFGHIQDLLPLHELLIKSLDKVKEADGSFQHIGPALTEWVPRLQAYKQYCSNLLEMKEILAERLKESSSLSDFLQRCLESPFSRKLDLWTFLDSPRSRFTKYPLLLANIHKYTPKDEPDRALLYRTKKQFETLIAETDRQAGYSKCSYYKERLYFLDEDDHSETIQNTKVLYCHGCLKNKAGNKVDAFLFDTMFVITRQATRNGGKCYQVLSQPILTNDMYIEDIPDGEVRLGGSFRTTLNKGPIAKNAFRISPREISRMKTLLLQANDQHDKKQWLNNFQKIQKGSLNSSRSDDSTESVEIIDENQIQENGAT